jgi:RNA methyltransferase, TrmH family
MSESLKPLKWYRNMAAGKGRQEAGAFIVEGERAIRQIIAGGHGEILEILSVNEPSQDYRSYPLRRITETQLDYVASTRTPQGILAVVKIPAGIYSGSLPENSGGKVLILEDVQDPGNVGTLIRTSAAFDFSGLIMSGKSADPLSPKCVQASAGSTLSVWLRRTANYLDMVGALKKNGYSIVVADMNGKPDPSVLTGSQKIALALGNEGAGLSPDLLKLADYRLMIPIDRNKAESLNVAVCGAICMYLSSKQSG